jgi:hypothetical protein
MRRLLRRLLGLVVLLLLPIAFPSLVQAQSSASCEIPNRDQTGLDQFGGHPETACDASETCPSGMCSTRRLNFPRKLTLVVKFVKPNKKYAVFVLPGMASPTEPGEGQVEQCSCEAGQIIAKRAVDEVCCGIQQGGLNCTGAPGILKSSSDSSITPTPVIVTRNGSPCTGPGCCDTYVPPAFTQMSEAGRIDAYFCTPPTNWDPAPAVGPPAQPLTLGVNETSLNGGQPCAFDITYDPNATDTSNPNFHVAPNGPCKLAAVQFGSSAGNTVQADLLDRYLVQVNPNGINGIVTFTVQDLGGSNHSFTVNTASLPSLGALAAAIASGYSGLGLGLNVSVLSLPTLAQVPSLPSGGGFTMGPLVLISNAPQAARAFGVRGLEGQLIVTETSAPIGLF